MAKKAQIWALYLLLALIFVSAGLLAWNYNWFNIRPSFKDSNVDLNFQNPDAKCPKTMADMGKVCCEPAADDTGEIKAAVSAVYISASCKNCPAGTHFLMMAPEGGGNSYKICQCDGCSG